MFGTDIIGRKACTCAVLFQVPDVNKVETVEINCHIIHLALQVVVIFAIKDFNEPGRLAGGGVNAYF